MGTATQVADLGCHCKMQANLVLEAHLRGFPPQVLHSKDILIVNFRCQRVTMLLHGSMPSRYTHKPFWNV